MISYFEALPRYSANLVLPFNPTPICKINYSEQIHEVYMHQRCQAKNRFVVAFTGEFGLKLVYRNSHMFSSYLVYLMFYISNCVPLLHPVVQVYSTIATLPAPQ